MAYAQTNYSQIQGINGEYTIHDIGCFITSFCNILARFGHPIDPASLNTIFVQRGLYIDIDDGVRDDVNWDTITKYDSNLVVTGTGSASTPPGTNAIVKFAYNSFQTGRPTTHFCLVDHISNGTVYVIDSWDGVVKDASHYGGVKAWATYDYKTQTSTQGGSNTMFENDDQIQAFYFVLRGQQASAAEVAGWRGKSMLQFVTNQYCRQEVVNREAEKAKLASDLSTARSQVATDQTKISDLQIALAAAQKTPATNGNSSASAADQADAAKWRNAKTVIKDLVA